MRKILSVLVLSIGLAWVGVASAQVPRTMSYQGSLTDAAGTPVADGAYTLVFSLYTAASGGVAIFSEQQNVSVAKGVFSAIIGGVTVGGIPAAIPFTGQYYLGIGVNGAAELLPRTALTASPYALNAVTSTGLVLPVAQTASSGAPLLLLTNTSLGGTGVFGVHAATTGNFPGVRGETASTGTTASGVEGAVTATTSGASSAGVRGTNYGNAGAGVLGGHLGDGAGVFGTSQSGYGVRGETASTGFYAAGVYGAVTAAVPGEGSAGVWGSGSGSGGNGVYGGHSGTGIGVQGYSGSGTGVFGMSSTGRAGYFKLVGAASASNAVEVETSGTGSAGYFLVSNAASSAAALRGTTGGPGAGVSGSSGTGPGVAGSSDSFIGVRGWGDSPTGIGVYGAHTATTGGNPGVKGESNSTVGGIGVTGSGSGYGVYGASLLGIGVYGSHQGPTGTDPGVHGQTYSNDASAVGVTGIVLSTTPGGSSAGVRGINNGNGGNGIGVYGSQSGSGWGVYGTSVSGRGVYALTGGLGVGVYAENNGTGTALVASHSGASGDIAKFQSVGSNVARIDKTGKGFFNGGTQTGGADLAEAFEVEGDREAYQPGDVLAISTRSDRTLEKSSAPNSTRVAGVYATKPGVLLTDLDIDADASRRVPLGVVGVIPTKVSAENGSVRRGDLLVTSAIPGHAMKAGATPTVGTVLGKALQDFVGPGTGVINVLVNVK